MEGQSLGEMEKVWRAAATTEMRITLMDSLEKAKVGFNDVENFNLGLAYNLKSLDGGNGRFKDRTVVQAAMELKRKDEIKHRRKIIGDKNKLRSMSRRATDTDRQ